MTEEIKKYDPDQSYQWNYDHAPAPTHKLTDKDRDRPELDHSSTSASQLPNRFCGLPVNSPFGIAAGPLLNGRWVTHYARLGFDVLTYKTVRSRSRACYPLPNLQPISEAQVAAGQDVVGQQRMQGSWAISFGMPSMSPDHWRADVAWTREQLPQGKLLSVSVVATPEPDWSLSQVADDYATCAKWAAESGADAIELNLSCPNVSSVDGQLYQQPEATRVVLETVRAAGVQIPLLIKIGYLDQDESIEALLRASVGMTDGIAMTNCLACRVKKEGRWLFDGEPRGIGGEAIRKASAAQVRKFTGMIRQFEWPLFVVGVGGVSTAEHATEYFQAGATAVHVATAAMLDPTLGQRLNPGARITHEP